MVWWHAGLVFWGMWAHEDVHCTLLTDVGSRGRVLLIAKWGAVRRSCVGWWQDSTAADGNANSVIGGKSFVAPCYTGLFAYLLGRGGASACNAYCGDGMVDMGSAACWCEHVIGMQCPSLCTCLVSWGDAWEVAVAVKAVSLLCCSV